jgi:O-acetyl-ADP-ribose deacetylase (regulator of RNase III)
MVVVVDEKGTCKPVINETLLSQTQTKTRIMAVATASAAAAAANITEVEGDLFTSNSAALAHCVSECLTMGAGIAIPFKKFFGRVNLLKEQNKGPGQVAWLCVPMENDKVMPYRFVFYLVTKKVYNHKPLLEDIRKSLLELRRLCQQHEIRTLSIPRLACGKDGKDWCKEILPMLHEVFSEMPELAITVYRL